MGNKLSIICMILIIVIIFSFSNINNDAIISSNEYLPVNNSTEKIEFQAVSFSDLENKLKVGDMRAINQNEYNDWKNSCKDFFAKWYNLGTVPYIPFLKNTNITSYELDEEMMLISFNEKEYEDNSYYEIITLKKEYCMDDLNIEKFYKEIITEQNDNLNLVGGEYSELNIGDSITNVAVCDFADGTMSVDFIWKNKYWVRTWDKKEQLKLVLQNFGINEFVVNAPLGFEDEQFEAYVEYPNKERIEYTSVGQFMQDKNNLATYSLLDINKNPSEKTPLIVLDDTYNLTEINYELDYMDEKEYINYIYSDDNKNTIDISVYPNSYPNNYIEWNHLDCINIVSKDNPYIYNQDYIDEYGVYIITDDQNEQYYTLDEATIDNEIIKILKYYNSDYEYSEVVVVLDNYLVKISCNKQNYTEKLMDIISVLDLIQL